MSGNEVSLFFPFCPCDWNLWLLPQADGENIAQGERSLEMFSGDVFKQRMLWFLLLVEIPLDTELEN